MKFLPWLMLFVPLAAPAALAPSLSIFSETQAAIRAGAPADCASRPVVARIREARALCGQPLSAWRTFAMAFLDSDRPASALAYAELMNVVERNTRISESYAQLYLFNQASAPGCGHSLLPWLAGASLGSFKSGGLMRSGLSEMADGQEYFDHVTDTNYRPRFRERLGFLSPAALRSVTLALGAGNRAIFRDLFWQLLAGSTCGPGEVTRVIEGEANWPQDPKLEKSHRAWALLREAMPVCDEPKAMAASMLLVDVEQYLVGQPIMYDGPEQQLGGWMLSSEVEAAIPEALGHFPGFVTYSYARHVPRLRMNFANAAQRVAWMKDQLTEMEREFVAQPEFRADLFCAIAGESEATRNFLKLWQSEAEPRRNELLSSLGE